MQLNNVLEAFIKSIAIRATCTHDEAERRLTVALLEYPVCLAILRAVDSHL